MLNTRLKKIESFNVFGDAKALLLFNFRKKFSATLTMSAIFTNPKNPPRTRFTSPSPLKSAIFVNTFASKTTPTTTAINVSRNAVMLACLALPRCPLSIVPANPINFTAINNPSIRATTDASSANKPFHRPFTSPYTRIAPIMISINFIKAKVVIARHNSNVCLPSFK